MQAFVITGLYYSSFDTSSFTVFYYSAEYENKAQAGDDFTDCNNLDEESRDPNKVCRFTVDMLGNDCTWQKDYGYDEGTPCVLLKLNKVDSH